LKNFQKSGKSSKGKNSGQGKQKSGGPTEKINNDIVETEKMDVNDHHGDQNNMSSPDAHQQTASNANEELSPSQDLAMTDSNEAKHADSQQEVIHGEQDMQSRMATQSDNQTQENKPAAVSTKTLWNKQFSIV